MKQLFFIIAFFLATVYIYGQADSNMVEIQAKTTLADTDVLIVSGSDTVYYKITYASLKTLLDAIYEAADANITKDDAAETITVNWIFSDSTGFRDNIDLDGNLIYTTGTLTQVELSYLDGGSSAFQTQINAKEGTLTNEAGLYAALSDVDQFLEDADSTTLWITLTQLNDRTVTADDANPFAMSVSDTWVTRTAAQMRTGLALVIGTNVQAWDTDLDGWALIPPATGSITSTGIVSGGSRTPVTDATTDFAANFTGDDLYGGTFVCDTDDGDLQLPAVGVGMNFTIITVGAIQIVVEPNASDAILLDGVQLDDADSATNLSTAGDIITFQYYSAAGWIATSNGWTDED